MHSIHPTSSTSTTATISKDDRIAKMTQTTVDVKTMDTQKSSPKSEMASTQQNSPKSPMELASTQRDLPSMVFVMQERETLAVLESEKSIIMADARDLEKGIAETQWKKIARESGILELLVTVQMSIALFLILSSLSLAVAGSSGASMMFLGGALLIVPLFPVFISMASGSSKAHFIFKVMLHISAFLNIFWAFTAWLVESSAFPRNFLLLVIAGLQYTALFILSFDEYSEKREHKKRKKTDSMRSESRSKSKKKKSKLRAIEDGI